MTKKVILITGASSGIGFKTAELLAKQGHKVYGAARRVESLNELKSLGVVGVRMDVTDDASMEAGVRSVLDAEGRIDVLINNAGFGFFGPVEEVSIPEAKRQFDVNVFGAMRLVQLVLPAMRKQGCGRIINTSSMGGLFTTYFGGWYHATKYALESLSDALRMELKQFGIDVVLIEPGCIKTPWGGIAARHLEETTEGTPYQQEAARAAAIMNKFYDGNLLSRPEVIAKAISKAVNAKRPKARYLRGFMAHEFVFLHALLPTRWFDRLMIRFS